MATYAQTLAIRRAFMASLARLEESATGEMVRAYTVTMDRIEADIARALENDTPLAEALRASFDGSPDTLRISILKGRAEYVAEQFDRFGVEGARHVRKLAPNAYRLGITHAKEQVRAVSGTFSAPSRRTIEQTVARLQAGTTQAGYFAEFARTSAQQAMDTMIAGVSLGENPNQIADRLRGTMSLGQARLRTFARTEVMGAARAGLGDSYRENADVLDGWIWNAEEDATTCEVCWAMNGTVHSLDEDLDSHPNCRCVQTPQTRTFDDILGTTTDITETRAEEFDPDERFADVLTPDQQIKVLGPSKYALWSDGNIRLGDLVEPTFSPKWGPGKRAVTLRELRARGVAPASVIDQTARRSRGRR